MIRTSYPLSMLSEFSESQIVYLSGEKGITSVKAFLAVACEELYGRPELLKGLEVSEKDFDELVAQARKILETENEDSAWEPEKKWQPLPAPAGTLFPDAEEQDETEFPDPETTFEN
ncbi:hypothetical protein [Maridesulfovibrio sp.]|uniref:hypothetical protein n=1 Tax=Maridesulfovibrio sp. TaxID=2795000 RepID=UPI0039F020F6